MSEHDSLSKFKHLGTVTNVHCCEFDPYGHEDHTWVYTVTFSDGRTWLGSTHDIEQRDYCQIPKVQSHCAFAICDSDSEDNNKDSANESDLSNADEYMSEDQMW